MNTIIENLLTYENSFLEYHKWGTGTKWLICFHGYGKEAVSMKPLVKRFCKQYTILSVSLPCHGKSDWNEKRPLSREDWRKMLSILLQKNGITGGFSLLGYSIGARWAMSVSVLYKDKCEELLLLAPDGIKDNIVFSFATKTQIGKTLMKIFAKFPQFIFLCLNIFVVLGVIDKAKSLFFKNKYDTYEKRILLKKRWLQAGEVSYSRNEYIMAWEHAKPQITIVVGVYDKIIKPCVANLLIKWYPKVKVIELNEGHNLIKEEAMLLI